MPFVRDIDLVDLQPEDDLGETLVGDLVEVGDELRGLYAQFGAADYRVFLVHVAWSGAQRGEGTQSVLSQVELLPTPLTTVPRRREVLPVGSVENGDLELRGVSLTYTEDQLAGRGAGGVPVARNVDFFYELRTFDDDLDRRIRCTPSGPPVRDQINVQWRVPLTVQRPTRGRGGQLP